MKDSYLILKRNFVLTAIFGLSLAMMIIIGGCKKKNNNPVSSSNNTNNSQISFTLNGSDYNKQDISVTSSASEAVYVTTKEYTLGTVSGKNGNSNVSIILAFPGKSTGTFTWDTTSSSTVFALSIGGVTYSGIPGQGSTKITDYGDVGSAIKGNFSGKIFGVSGTTLDTLQVTGGKFSMIRGKDQTSVQGTKF